MKQKTIVYMIIEWDDAHTTDPRKWDPSIFVNEEFGEKVTDIGTNRLPIGCGEDGVKSVMENVQDTATDTIASM